MTVVSRSFEHYTGDSTIWLGSTPILREDTWEWSGVSHLSTPSTNHMRALAARRLFRVPPCRKGTIHYIFTVVPVPPASQSASLTTVLVGRQLIAFSAGCEVVLFVL
ncbi:hypothetical protein TNCV_1311681 [Trichonephila clavipes]|nr:hypothetical protein TNCV_1311681 [Trichonephila clavipes]